ncbi:MAG: hypothetical protein II114_07620 [Treponema sp.]|nr:hypothetical protein [Treponema sp.]MBQ4236940.1 hypothetical protein [Treponema sp.]MBQ5384706.1 hypothetical protein [Treponema sp.]
MKISSVSKKILTVLIAAAGTHVFAQSTSFPSISSPSMPTIEAPVIGSGYYRPGISSSSQSKSSKSSSTQAASGTSTKTADVPAVKGLSVPLPSLTADDIKDLNINGVLETILENNQKEPLSETKDSEETEELLRQVLSEIEEIKNSQNKSSAEAKTVANVPVPAQTVGSRLLRFKVNGYDVLRTCRTVFISDVQEDGTFLVTGDRRYQSDGATRTETFHLLFKADSKPNGVKSYNAAAAVTQDYLNENSFLYQMSQREDMQATRTGNLITLRTTDPLWKLELLIDLGSTSR